MKYECPAGLRVEIKDLGLKVGAKPALACVAYERSIPSLRPSAEYCPSCQYNTDTLRKKADEDLDMKVREFMARNGVR